MVTISDCISEYPHSFGRKVFGEILSAPGLEVFIMQYYIVCIYYSSSSDF